MLSDAQRTMINTGRRMETWLDEVKRGPQRRKLLRALEVLGRRAELVPAALRDADRVAMTGPTALPVVRPTDLAPAAARATCMSFEGCGGTGVRSATLTEGAEDAAAAGGEGYAIEYCWCAAGERRRAQDIAARGRTR